MTAMLSSFFRLDSLTVNDGGGAVTATTTTGEAGEMVATSGARESLSRNERSSMSLPFDLFSMMLALSPLICNKTLDEDTPVGIFFLSCGTK